MTKSIRGSWQRFEQARAAKERLQLHSGNTVAGDETRRYRAWQRVVSALVAATLFIGPITVTVEQGRAAAGVLAAGDRHLSDDAWREIQDLASLHIRFVMQTAEAAAIADPAAPLSFQPKITQSTGSGGGVPVVNITAPNSAGISLNQYQSFNVDPIGLILNNSLQGGTTLTGGNVAANPNLNGRTASMIVNQVTSTGSAFMSVLNGPLEVFGAPATVIIANPNGIAVRGAGFTNTIGVTLTTGTPQFLTGIGGTQTDFTNAQAVAYDVKGGHIQIEGNAGTNGPGAGIEGTVGTIDLIGETVGINAPLYAGTKINVIAGDQVVSASATDSTGTTYTTQSNGSANTAASIGNATQGYAIDATNFGAMTAGQISVIGTAQGMGVRTDAALSANAGNLTLSSNGDLTTNGSGLSVGNYQLTSSGDILSTGTVTSNADLSMSAGHNVTVTAQTTAVNNIGLSAGQDVVLTGSLASGKELNATAVGAFNVAGSLLVGTDATIASGTFNVSGVAIVQQNGTLSTQGDIAGNGSIAFGQSGALTSGHDVNLTGKLLANALQVNAANSATFADVQAGDAFAVVANGAAGNGNVTFNGNAASVGDASVQAAGDVIVNGTLAGGAQTNVAAQGNVTVAATGTLQSVGDLSMSASMGSVNSTGAISTHGTLVAKAAQNLALTGTTEATGDATLTAGTDATLGGTFASQGNGTITAGHDVTLAGSSGFTNDVSAKAGNNVSVSGALQGNNVTLTANNAIALNDVQSNAALTVNTTGAAGSGNIAVDGTVASLSTGTVNAAGAVAVNGTLKTASTLNVTASTDTTVAGMLTSNGNMTLANSTGSLTSTGTIQSGASLAANAARSIDLGTGATSSLGDLSLTAGQNITMNGTVVSQDNGTIKAGGAIGGAASLAFGLAANLNSVGDTTLTGSLRGATIQASAGGSDTFADVQAGSDISLAANHDLNVTGTLVGGSNVRMTAGNDINVSGTTTVTLDTALQSGRDITVTGTLNGQGNGYLSAGRDIVGNGSLGFQQSALLTAAVDIAQGGLIQGQSVQASAGGNLALNNVQSTTTVGLNAGTSGAGDLTVNGAISAAQSITATAFGNVMVGNNGKLAAGSTLGVTALNDINVAGALESAGDVAVQAQLGSLNAIGGVNSGGMLSITTGLDLSLGASTTSIGDMTLTAGRNAVLNGTLVGQGNGFVTANQDITGPGIQAFTAAAVLSAQRDILLTGGLQANSVQATGGDSASLNDVTSATTLSLTAHGNAGNGDASITGTVKAPGVVAVQAARDAIVSGSVAGGSTVGLTAARNATVTGAVQSVSDLTVTATNGTASLTGTATTSGALNVGSGLDTIFGGQTNATGAVIVEAGNNLQLNGSLAGQSTGTLTAAHDIGGAGSAAFAQAAQATAGNDLALTGSLQGASVAVVGLNNVGLGTVQSMSGDISVTALGLAGQGDVTLNGSATSKGNVLLEAARDINVAGVTNSIGTATISAAHNVTTADVTAGGALSMKAEGGGLSAGNLKTDASFAGTAANSVSTGSVNAGGTVTLQAQGLDGTGDINVGGALAAGSATTITAAHDATLGSTVTGGDTLTVSAGRNLAANGAVSTGADTSLTAVTGNLNALGSITTAGKLAASAGGSLALAGGLVNGSTTLTSGTGMTLTGALYGLGAAKIASGGAIVGGGSLTIGGDIALTSGAGVTLGGIQGAGQLAATAVGDMSLGATTAVGNVLAKSTAGSVTFNGDLQSAGNVQISAANNAAVTGMVSSVGNATVTGMNGNVNAAGVSANGDATLTAGKSLTLSGSSVVAGALAVTAANVTLSGSQSSSKSITVTAQGTLDASQSSIVSSQNLSVSGTNVTLGNAVVGGTLNAQASNQLSLVGGAVDVVGGTTLSSQNGFYNASNVLSGGALNVSALNITNAANASLASTNSTTITATNFTNAGLVNGNTTSIDVAGTLNNSGGSLMGVNALTINTGALNNQGGLIFAGDPNSPTGATGDLSVTINGGGNAFANASGELLAQRNLTIGAVNAALDPSQGTISQGGQLSITAGSIDVAGTWNYGGQGVSIYGFNGITNSGTMTGAAPLTISTNGTFTNNGQIIGQDVTFNGVLSNVGNAIMHAGDTMVLNGSVTNRGTIESAGNLTFNGGGNNFDNQYGTTQANGNITLSTGGTVYNSGGLISAAGNVNINAGSVINDAFAAAAQTQTQLVSASADSSLVTQIVIGTKETWGCVGVGQGACYVGGTFSNATISNLLPDLAAGVIDVTSGGLDPDWQGVGPSASAQVGTGIKTTSLGFQAASPSDIRTIALPGIDRTTTSPGAATPGVITAGGSINITAGSLSNAGSTISAGLDVNLQLQSLNNATLGNSTTTVVDTVDKTQLDSFVSQLYALGLLGIAGTEGVAISETIIPETTVSVNKTAPVPPTAVSTITGFGSQGQIIAGRNMTLSGGNLVNGGVLYAGNNFNASSAQSFINQGQYNSNTTSQPGCATGVSGTECARANQLPAGNPTSSSFSYAQQNATVYAGNDLVIAAGQISNTYGNLLAGHDIVIGGVGTTATSTTPASSLTNTSGNIIAGNNVTLAVSGAVTNTLPPPVTIHQNYGSKEAYAGCMTAGGYKESYCESYVDQQSGNSSNITAGNSLQVTAGSLANIGSLISAGTSATINVSGPVINEAQTLNAYWHSHWVQETGDFDPDIRHDVWACGSVAECTQLYGSAYTRVGGTIDPPQPVGNIAATIQAPNLSISANGVIQNVGNVVGTSVQLSGQKLINGITTANTYTPRVNGPSQIISLSGFNLPGLRLSALESGSGGSSSSTPGQASYVQGLTGGTGVVVGPQQLLSELPANLQPSSTLFYYNPEAEDLMLQQAALQQTGEASFIGGLSYDRTSGLSVTDQEKAILYQNALDYAKKNGLQLGVTLSQTQVNALTQPMLWYVEQTVPDPSCLSTGPVACPTVTALMPQVYLPPNSSALSADGNIVGQNVTLDFNKDGNGSVLNTGDIAASNTLTVNTNTLTNRANQVDVGQIWQYLQATGYEDTTGTEVQPGGFMSAANMNLNVSTLNQIGGALQKLNGDGTVDQAGTQQLVAALQQQLGANFTQTSLSDNLHTGFTAEGGFGAADITMIAFEVVVAIMTAGAASAAIGATMGTTAGSTFAAAVPATTTAAGTSAGLGNIALSAAISGFTTSTLSQLATTGGVNWGSAFEAAGVAAITAGLTNGITYNSSTGLGFTTQPLTVGGPTSSLAMLSGVQSVGGAMVPQAGSATASNLPEELLALGANATISAGVQTAIEGGSFLNSLKGAAASDLAAAGAFAIGNALPTLQSDLGQIGGEAAYIGLHGALGCAASAAEGTGCAGGAIGGATSAALTPFIANAVLDGSTQVSPAQTAVVTALAGMLGGVAAGAAGANAQAGATFAENEAQNNCLNHPESCTQMAKNALAGVWNGAVNVGEVVANIPNGGPLASPGDPGYVSLDGLRLPYTPGDQIGPGTAFFTAALATEGVGGGAAADGEAEALSTTSAANNTLSFSQTTASPWFSNEGTFAGLTISDVAAQLRAGTLSPADLPVQTIDMGGNTLIINTRSSLALSQAGIPQSQWALVDMTGDAAAQAAIAGRLGQNGLTNSGTSTLRITGSGQGISTYIGSGSIPPPGAK